MDEKDPFGDKLKDKERAEEDLYFAKRDRELVEKMRRPNDPGREATPRESAGERCPRCGQRLAHGSTEVPGAEECPSCRKIWLDEPAAKRSRETGREGLLGRLFRYSSTQTR